MERINQIMRYLMCVLLLTVVMGSCATISELKVNYRLPPQSDSLTGTKVFLGIEDERSAKDILGAGARKEFRYFSGNLSYSMARDEEEGFMIGIYDAPSLFKEVFKTRLENMGAGVVTERVMGDIEMVIVLKDLVLDLIGNQWKVSVNYEARLIQDEKILSKQMISGEGERLRIVGRKQAHILMGEIFTDTVNRLDVRRLFKQAGL